jgi:hypothetical protein
MASFDFTTIFGTCFDDAVFLAVFFALGIRKFFSVSPVSVGSLLLLVSISCCASRLVNIVIAGSTPVGLDGAEGAGARPVGLDGADGAQGIDGVDKDYITEQISNFVKLCKSAAWKWAQV